MARQDQGRKCQPNHGIPLRDVIAMMRAFETYGRVLTGQVNVSSDACKSVEVDDDEDYDVTTFHLAPLRISLLGRTNELGNDDDDDTSSDTSDVSDISSVNSVEAKSPPKTTPPNINF
ncbi:Aste57867_15874 [Aphanomyces stellatus]|uniref:Aste57867_15874 protein n=1 Tax=Aphanomyces stellatus TaxID=120398 RepID=A0A485L4G0_9STRA|nr:hypothetical protein As57867_015818 [Aphanomyces stellatus]VFT92661.1 Aste57867_15874 [Aphanomyces stellatus]